MTLCLSGAGGPNKSARIKQEQNHASGPPRDSALRVAVQTFNSFFIWIMGAREKKGQIGGMSVLLSWGTEVESVLVKEGVPNCPAGPNPGRIVLGDMWPAGIL